MARALILLLLVSLTGLSPFAAASPPDPVWVHGIYDAADYDDVVSLVTFSEARELEFPAALGRPLAVVGLRTTLATDSLPRAAPWSTLRLRSPPAG